MSPAADIAQSCPHAWRRVLDAVESALEMEAEARIPWLRTSSGLAHAEMRVAEEMLSHVERIANQLGHELHRGWCAIGSVETLDALHVTEHLLRDAHLGVRKTR